MKYDKGSIMDKALHMPARFIWVLLFIWLCIIAGLIYWMVVV